MARQGETIILRVGNGPQFLEIPSRADAKPGIAHFGLSVDNFNPDRVVGILKVHESLYRRNRLP